MNSSSTRKMAVNSLRLSSTTWLAAVTGCDGRHSGLTEQSPLHVVGVEPSDGQHVERVDHAGQAEAVEL